MKKRFCSALSALTLCLALLLALGSAPLALAAEPAEISGEYAGYLVILSEPDPNQATLFAAEDWELITLDETNRIYKADALSDIRDLVYDGRVTLVEPDYKAELFGGVTANPNDPAFQRTLIAGLNGDQYPLLTMEVQSAWDVGISGNGVTVAVIDSGIYLDHEDLPAKVAPGRYFFYYEEENGRYSFYDSSGVERKYNYYSSNDVNDTYPGAHGTMSSGIIAANTDNGIDMAGIAPGVTIMPIRCFTNEKGFLGGYTSNLVSGLDYARTHGADIINMSWGILAESGTLKTAIDSAANAGCILIAAAGNDGASAPLRYPAAWSNVIGVGATDRQNQLCSFSQRNNTVRVCAPGSGIYSLYNTGSDKMGTGNGTSFSAPAVTGVCALLKEILPNMTQQDFLSLLTPANCIPVEGTGAAEYGGCGVINVRKLLDAVGCAGASASLAGAALSIRGAYHPKLDDVAEGGYIALAGIYNEAGHLLASRVMDTGAEANDFGSFAGTCTFEDIGEAVTYQVHYLRKDPTLQAAAPAYKATIGRD